LHDHGSVCQLGSSRLNDFGAKMKPRCLGPLILECGVESLSWCCICSNSWTMDIAGRNQATNHTWNITPVGWQLLELSSTQTSQSLNWLMQPASTITANT